MKTQFGQEWRKYSNKMREAALMNFQGGEKCIFNTNYPKLKKYNKTEVEIIRPLYEEEYEYEIEDVGYMYMVKFADGSKEVVFEDELWSL